VSKYNVSIFGHTFADLTLTGATISLPPCSLTPSVLPATVPGPSTPAGGFLLNSEIDATDEATAEREAITQFETAIAILQLANVGHVRLFRDTLTVKPLSQGHLGQATLRASATVTILLDDTTLINMSKAAVFLRSAVDRERAEAIKLALRWYNSAENESVAIDQFWKYWVALESLCRRPKPNPTFWKRIKARLLGSERGEHTVSSIVLALQYAYPASKYSRGKMKKVVSRIYGLRNTMFHEGEMDRQDVAQLRSDLRQILREVLLSQLNVEASPQAFATRFAR
jgi:hypothetical protein